MYLLQSRISAVLKPDQNQEDRSGYRVTSLYFDDLFDSHLKDTEDGNARREKYRIRIYNNSLDKIKLEIKYKQYNRVLKESCSISETQMQDLINCRVREYSAEPKKKTLHLFQTAISGRGLRPKVVVEYDRKAYVFEPGNVRITFDRRIRASGEVERLGQKDVSFREIRGMNNVLEVKYDEFLPEFIAQLLELGNMRQTSCSKYRLCRERIQNGVSEGYY